MNKMFGKVLAGAFVTLALFAWTSQAEAFGHRWHGSSGGWGSSGGSGGSWGGSSGGSSGWYGGSSGGSSGSWGSSGGGWHHRHHHRGWGSSGGSWGGSSGGSSGSWSSSGGSSGGSYYYAPADVYPVDPSLVPPAGAVPPAGIVPPAGAVPPAGTVPGTPTSINRADGLLAVNVPDDAKIFVNGQPTTSTGSLRQYISRDLKNGFNYSYEVRAEAIRDGKTVEQLKTVNVRAGETATVNFDFPATQEAETSLTVHVPADAKVYLAGNPTKAGGEKRVFRTTGLAGDKSWEGYTVRVELERGGRVITKEETISLKAGESRELRFEFEGDKVASSR
jgi:uncharacterized protein (TIGR03000 family)